MFHVNEDLLCDNSKFFKAALKKEWREGQTRKIDLAEHGPEVFNLWLNWLHGRRILMDNDDGENAVQHFDYGLLIKAYHLGDMLLDRDFKDALCDALAVTMSRPVKGIVTVPNEMNRKSLYEVTAEGARIRRLVVDRVVRSSNGHNICSEADHPAAFLLDCARANLTQNDDPKARLATPAKVEACEFHEHGADACYRTKYANISVLSVELEVHRRGV